MTAIPLSLQSQSCHTNDIRELCAIVSDAVDNDPVALGAGRAVASVHDLYVGGVGVHHRLYVGDSTLEATARHCLEV